MVDDQSYFWEAFAILQQELTSLLICSSTSVYNQMSIMLNEKVANKKLAYCELLAVFIDKLMRKEMYDKEQTKTRKE